MFSYLIFGTMTGGINADHLTMINKHRGREVF